VKRESVDKRTQRYGFGQEMRWGSFRGKKKKTRILKGGNNMGVSRFIREGGGCAQTKTLAGNTKEPAESEGEPGVVFQGEGSGGKNPGTWSSKPLPGPALNIHSNAL